MKSSKLLTLALSVIVLLSFLTPVLTVVAQETASIVAADEVIQTVNGDSLTAAEFIEAAKYYRFNLIQQYNYYVQIYQMYGVPVDDQFNAQFVTVLSTPGDPTVGTIVLDNHKHQVVVAAEAEKAGIVVSDEDVDAKLKELFGFGEEAVTAVDSDEEEGGLEALGAEGVSTEPEVNKELEFRQTVDEYFSTFVLGAFTYDFFKNDIRNIVLEEKLTEYVLNNSDEIYEREEVNARHILVKTEEEAQAILDKLAAGEEWDALAAENSRDTGNKDKGGDLGWFPRGMMVPPFEEAAFALEPGTISDPVKTDFGYHIIAVDGKEIRPIEGADLEAARAETYKAWFEEVATGYETETNDIWETISVTEPVFEPFVSPVATPVTDVNGEVTVETEAEPVVETVETVTP